MGLNRIALLFPGQGAQYVGMGRDLVHHYHAARRVFATADDALGFSISDLCFNGPEERLILTQITQPAITAVSMACWAVLAEHGIEPRVAAGLSLGEYGALVAAGSFDLRTAVWLVHERGRLMEEAVPAGEGGMGAILGLSAPEVDQICQSVARGGHVKAANYNCPGQVVIAGHSEAVAVAGDLAVAKGARFVPLAVSSPFHTRLLSPAAEKLAAILAQIDIKAPKFPVVANVSGDYVTTASQVKESLIQQVSSPVQWEGSIRRMLADGYETFIEVGPGKVLSGFLKRIAASARCFNVYDLFSLKKSLAELKGVG
jgi:[acyl-carrier-protein] S-malonyltransferase